MVLRQEFKQFVDPVHPAVIMSRAIKSTGTEQHLVGGTVLGEITAEGLLLPFNAAATDGTQDAAGILLADVTVPASGNLIVDVYEHGVFIQSGLNWNGADTAQIKTAAKALKAAGIYIKG